MISILLTITLGTIAYFFHYIIRKQFTILLGFVIVLSTITFFLDFDLITHGFIGFAFFLVVMFASVFPKGTNINKRLRSIRKEYSILGFIILLPHAIKYVIQFLTGSYPVEWFGIISYVIMIPLFITSFHYVKKKMDIKKWIALQRFAYLVYAAIFIHLLLIAQSDHLPMYVIIFSIYTLLKLRNNVFHKYKTIVKTILSVVITALFITLSLVLTKNITIPNPFEAEETTVNTLEDGTYTGYSTGYNNMDISLEVVIENGEIITINVFEYGATAPRHGVNFQAAADDVINTILLKQSTEVDTVSGATKTTSGIIRAVEDALS